MKSNLANNVDAFVPDENVFDELPDGRRIQVAVAGVPIPRSEAMRFGLVKPETAAEKAAAEDAEANSSAAANYNKEIAEKRGIAASENKSAVPAVETKRVTEPADDESSKKSGSKSGK